MRFAVVVFVVATAGCDSGSESRSQSQPPACNAVGQPCVASYVDRGSCCSGVDVFLVCCTNGRITQAHCTDGIAASTTSCDVFVDAGTDADGEADAAIDADAAAADAPALDAEETADAALEKAASPTFAPVSGTMDVCPISVTLASTTPAAQIHWTKDGTKPTTSSALYAGPIVLSTSGTYTLRAIASAEGFADSNVSQATYTVSILASAVESVVFSPPSGAYATDQTVTLSSATAGATICWTLDGSSPTCDHGVCTGSATTYTEPIVVTPTKTGVTVRALACKGCHTNSTVTSATYTTP